MARIETYQFDTNLSLDDFIIGSDADNINVTRNYPLGSIFSTFKTALNLASIEYTFSDATDPTLDEFDAGYFVTNGNNTAAAAITAITLNTLDLNNIDITSLLEVIDDQPTSFVLRVFKASVTGQVFYFAISSIVDNLDDTFTINVTNFVGGNSLIDATTYSMVFDLAGVPSIYTETDPVFLASPVGAVSAGDVTNWTTAYGWGDHASGGYQAALSGTGIVKSTAGTISYLTDNSINWDAAFAWGDHSVAGYLTSYTETDPVFLAHDAFAVTSVKIGTWDLAYGWGDHSVAGYISAESDPIFLASDVAGVTTADINTWDAAYQWGDHSAVGYLEQVFVTLSTGASDSGNWTKVATVTLIAQSDNSTAFIGYHNSTNVQAEARTGFLTFRVRQESAFGVDPLVSVKSWFIDETSVDIGYVIVQNTPTSIVDIYVQPNNTDTTIHGTAISMDGTTDIVWLSGGAYVTTPAGIVEVVSDKMILTSDIDTLAELNSIVTDATLIDSSYADARFVRTAFVSTKTGGDLVFNDSIKAAFGTSSDMLIFHNGVENYIQIDVGDLIIREGANDRITFARTDGAITTTGNLTISKSSPEINMYNTAGAVDEKNWDVVATADTFIIRALTDAFALAATPFSITRSTSTITDIDLTATTVNIPNGQMYIATGTTGDDATLTLETDTGNNPAYESAHPSIRLKQDGALVDWRIGIGREDTDTGAEGNQLVITSVTANSTGIFYSDDNGVTANEIWHEGNDGSGSGLDADTLRTFAPSTGTGINTVALRNSAGDLYAEDFRADDIVFSGLAGTQGSSLRVYGTGTGTGNIGYMTIHESDGTRQGYVGFPSGGHSNMIMYSDAATAWVGLDDAGGANGLLYHDGTENIVYHTGNHPIAGSGAYWDTGASITFAIIGSGGSMEIGKYIDFHLLSTSTSDNDGRLTLQTANVLDFDGQFECDELRIEGTGDVGLATTTHGFQIGSTTGENLAMDNNEIMARNNSAAGTLRLHRDGGTIVVFGATAGDISFNAANSTVTMNDNVDLRFGNSGGESYIYSSGTHTYWNSISTAKDIYFQAGAVTKFTFNMGTAEVTAVDFNATSDATLKTNVKPISDYNITTNWVEYDWIENGNHDIGLIAQDLEKTNPEFVRTSEEGIKSIKYIKVLIAKAIEKDKQMKEKDRQIVELRNKNKTLEERMDRLEGLLTIGRN